jgi:hypothetical protein|tara:strand:- start:133 stop:318 length:186 start_codon:yes stop_codon:yes gene_type:complete
VKQEVCLNKNNSARKDNQMNKIKQLIQKLEREKEPLDKLMCLNQVNKELELIKKELLKKIK